MAIAGIALLALLPQAAAADAGCGVPPDLAKLRDDHLTLLNRIRLRQGRDELAANDRLDRIAQDYACLLAASGHFDHVGPDGSTLADRVERGHYRYCVIAENLAKGQASVSEALIGWVGSPGHWENLRRREVNEVGFGIAFENDAPSPPGLPGRKTHVWVEVFGKPCE